MSVETLRRDRPLGRGEAKDPLGRAARFACTLETGTTCELWCFSATDAALVKRLAGLGLRGVGGFDLGFGEDGEGAFLVRRVPSLTLDGMGKGERVEGLTALAKVRDLARALAACEEAAIFPGPLRPVDEAAARVRGARAAADASGVPIVADLRVGHAQRLHGALALVRLQ